MSQVDQVDQVAPASFLCLLRATVHVLLLCSLIANFLSRSIERVDPQGISRSQQGQSVEEMRARKHQDVHIQIQEPSPRPSSALHHPPFMRVVEQTPDNVFTSPRGKLLCCHMHSSVKQDKQFARHALAYSLSTDHYCSTLRFVPPCLQSCLFNTQGKTKTEKGFGAEEAPKIQFPFPSSVGQKNWQKHFKLSSHAFDYSLTGHLQRKLTREL